MTLSTHDEIILRKAEILSRMLLCIHDGSIKWEAYRKIENMLNEVKTQ